MTETLVCNHIMATTFQNSTNSCALIALFNTLKGCSTFTEAISQLKPNPEAAGVLEELHSLVNWDNSTLALPDALRMLLAAAEDGLELANVDTQDPADFYTALLKAIEIECVPSFNIQFKQLFHTILQETFHCKGTGSCDSTRNHINIKSALPLPVTGCKSVQEGIQSYLQEEIRERTCPECMFPTSQVTKQFVETPEILVVQLLRQDLEQEVAVPPQLNLCVGGSQYRLIGMVCGKGSNHYISMNSCYPNSGFIIADDAKKPRVAQDTDMALINKSYLQVYQLESQHSQTTESQPQKSCVLTQPSQEFLSPSSPQESSSSTATSHQSHSEGYQELFHQDCSSDAESLLSPGKTRKQTGDKTAPGAEELGFVPQDDISQDTTDIISGSDADSLPSPGKIRKQTGDKTVTGADELGFVSQDDLSQDTTNIFSLIEETNTPDTWADVVTQTNMFCHEPSSQKTLTTSHMPLTGLHAGDWERANALQPKPILLASGHQKPTLAELCMDNKYFEVVKNDTAINVPNAHTVMDVMDNNTNRTFVLAAVPSCNQVLYYIAL